MSASERRIPGWLLPVGLGILIIALVAIALTRGPVSLDPDSAEGTVQEYLVAVNQERWDDAVAVIHDDWRGRCQGFDLQSFSQGDFSAELGAPSGFSGGFAEQEFTVVGEDGATEATFPPNTTTVEVTINHREGGGLGSTWQEYVTFELFDDGEFWWIVGDPWPYFVWSCQGG